MSKFLLAGFFALAAIFTLANGALHAQLTSTALSRLYDSSTLAPGSGTVLLPYNRLITPAGTILRFGNGEMENHSLDAVLLPGARVVAVEDRYGVAFVRVPENQLAFRLDLTKGPHRGAGNIYSGIKAYTDSVGRSHVIWSSSGGILDAVWTGDSAYIESSYTVKPLAPAPLPLPNELSLSVENGQRYVYVVLNGNNRLLKIRWSDKTLVWETPTGMAPYGVTEADGKIYVSNWAGPVPTDTTNTAGIPYGHVYVDPRTGATALGTVSVFDPGTGRALAEIRVGLHPNVVLAGGRYVYVANGNSDNISIIDSRKDVVVDSIAVRLPSTGTGFVGDTPDGLALNGDILYVSLGMDNAVAVVKLGRHGRVQGFIPTETYPAGLAIDGQNLYVANLEGEGARVPGKDGSYNSHRQVATFSVIGLPKKDELKTYTAQVLADNFVFRQSLSRLSPRPGVKAIPVPERIGEPSVFKHVIYVIKENRTYDQVLGDLEQGDGKASLCMYGDTVTPNQHQLARSFLLLDNYYASGKCSAEGHQWTDAGMVTDYVEKNVRAWFRSYPHVQTDALVYDREGFIWNDALDHGKTVRIYGEACTIHVHGPQDWMDIYGHLATGVPLSFTNITTISRVEPILDTLYPGFDGPNVADQFRANAFIAELHSFESMPGDQWPNLMVLALPNDHTVGTRAGEPLPEAMVADNDLALGRIVEAVSHSRFWDSTVILVTEDDSQAGWDHVSAYRTTGFVISPYSRGLHTIHTNYNQVSLLRTAEQILGIPPMNALDATAAPMTDCFSLAPDTSAFVALPNRVPLDRMNPSPTALRGKARHFAEMSALPEFDHIDGGDDDLLNHILWFAAMGDKPYPTALVLPKKERRDAD